MDSSTTSISFSNNAWPSQQNTLHWSQSALSHMHGPLKPSASWDTEMRSFTTIAPASLHLPILNSSGQPQSNGNEDPLVNSQLYEHDEEALEDFLVDSTTVSTSGSMTPSPSSCFTASIPGSRPCSLSLLPTNAFDPHSCPTLFQSSSTLSDVVDNGVGLCVNCGTQQTPLWRKIEGQTFCNACGLYYKQYSVHRLVDDQGRVIAQPLPLSTEETTPKKRQRPRPRDDLNCINCGSNKTPLWRKNACGAPLCNACGLYLKIHGEDRPVKLMTKARISAIPNVFETELATKMDVRSVDTRPVLTQCEDQIQRLQRLKLAIASDQGAHRHAITHALERMKQQLEVLMILNENSNNAVVGEPAVFQQGKRREC